MTKIFQGESNVPITAKAIFLTQFVLSTVKTFKIQFTLEVKAGKPYEKTKDDQTPFDIAGVIGLFHVEIDIED